MAHPEAVRVDPASPEPDNPVTFEQVLHDELRCINRSRPDRNVSSTARPDNLTGLAFSGGGIRSATFNLGILQALAEKGLLHQFDYLSTVSGGGYIGSWLAALTLRFTRESNVKFGEVEKSLCPSKYEPDRRSEPAVLHWLRLYSNYLTPHKGVISGDTWAMLGTWTRNVLLNQTILALMFMAVFVLCQSALLPWIHVEDQGEGSGLGFLISGGAMLFLASVSMAVNVVSESPSTAIPQTWFQRVKVTLTVMLPFVVACVLLNGALWLRSDFDAPTWVWALAGAAFYFVVWGAVAIMAWVRRLWRRHHGKPQKLMISILALVVFSPVAGAAGGVLLQAYVLQLNHLGDWTSTNWLVVVFGSGILMVIILLVGTLHIGLVGRGSMDVVREWWARLGGYLTLITLGWLLLAGTCSFGPLAVRWALYEMRGWSIGAGLLWVLHNYLGLKAASSAKTTGQENNGLKSKDGSGRTSETGPAQGSKIIAALKSPRALNILAKVAPYVFIVGLVLLLGTAVQIATGLVFNPGDTLELWKFNNGMNWPALSEDYWLVLEKVSAAWLAGLGGIFFLAGLALSWRVDVNDFSLHHFYRNRLVRCYLGASNTDRKPEPFTGFDPAADLPLSELSDNYPGPYPILNAALNITGGEELGYATRRAKSFVFTPLYCGYELSGDGPGRFTCDDGYLPSFSKTVEGRSAGRVAEFGVEGGISLGTAMAISGAAASPNMGYFTTPATAFFMALFDVRLGWWMGNPRYPKNWRSAGPALGLEYLLSEVFAQSDQKRRYVYLSDGGHFENLAVYELIRRHCRLIVACDADCDPQYTFDNLLSLIEKARTDFGARIEIKYEPIRPKAGTRGSAVNHAVGTIYYDPNNLNDTGTLIFIKASLPIKEVAGVKPSAPAEKMLPDDVWQYATLHPTFPHQTTADQWFDELQFESYRALGEYIGVHAAEAIGKACNGQTA
ncbi:MAG: patatin-like phospholipase family protein [Candidatus Sulfotelmatobacter sp.]